ncbi:MAG: hypothetical protein H0V45_01715, partial [Actinobacteria bacterium]|nr:hypothetical protein [Actinomycetota bacterium]
IQLRAAGVLVTTLRLWPRMPTTAAAMNEVARNTAREHDRHPARAPKTVSKPPTIERATPTPTQNQGPWASGGGSAGGSATGSGTLRIFALATMAVLPFARPRALRAPMRSSIVPTGELGLSPAERPG